MPAACFTLACKAVALAPEKRVVRTRDLIAIGAPRFYLRLMCEAGLLERTGYGLYKAANAKPLSQ